MEEELCTWHDLLETANAPIFGVDKLGQINLWNSMTTEILGFPKDACLGKSLVETFIDPLLRESVQVVVDMALEGQGTSNFELEIETQSGDVRYLLVNLTTRRRRQRQTAMTATETGDSKLTDRTEIVGVLFFAQDVTEAAQHDRAVAAMAQELRQLLDTANAPIFGVDPSGLINEWNDQTAEITGYSADEAFHEPMVETFVVPSLQPAVQEVLANALRGRGTSNFELEIITKTNEIRYLLINATTRRDAENNIVGVVAIGQDITVACKHDRALAAMANELRQLIDTANAPIFGIDRDGYVKKFVFVGDIRYDPYDRHPLLVNL
jgi:PAS domain S-box-containing protein